MGNPIRNKYENMKIAPTIGHVLESLAMLWDKLDEEKPSEASNKVSEHKDGVHRCTTCGNQDFYYTR